MPQPIIYLNENPDAPILHIASANGFPAETYIPCLRPLMSQVQAVNLPPRALWGDQTPPKNFLDWEHMADDLLAGLEQYDLNDVIGVGHSVGAIVTMIAAIKEPNRFRALVLFDPTILPPPIIEMMQATVDQFGELLNPLAERAVKRRANFPSQQTMYEAFRVKTLFQDWDAEAMQAYVAHGSMPNPNGDGVILRWSPAWESFYFSTIHLAIWETILKLNGLVPTLILRGADSDVYVTETADVVQGLLPSITQIEVLEHGHLFPQTAPKATAQIVRTWLGEILPN